MRNVYRFDVIKSIVLLHFTSLRGCFVFEAIEKRVINLDVGVEVFNYLDKNFRTQLGVFLDFFFKLQK